MEYQLITTDVKELNYEHILRRVSESVSFPLSFDEKNLIEAMHETIANIDHASGVSAIQLGVPKQIFVLGYRRKRKEWLTFINPTVIKLSDEKKTNWEGCLSLPGYKARVKRPFEIVLSAYNRNGVLFQHTASDYESAIIQHELDHLKGLLYIDKISNNETITKIK